MSPTNGNKQLQWLRETYFANPAQQRTLQAGETLMEQGAFNDRLYKIWVKVGGVLTELAPDEQAELRRRLSTVAEAVLKDQPKALAVYEVMKAAAERTRGK